MSFA
jgi:copine 1/2/3